MNSLIIKILVTLALCQSVFACPLCTSDGRPELVIILDRSGSMELIKADMEGGLKSYLDGLKLPPFNTLEFIESLHDDPPETPWKDPTPNVTLVQFDDKYELVHEAVYLGLIQDIVIEPRGTTALLDAVGKTLENVAERHKLHAPTKTIVVIITDGLENASKEYTREQVLSLIEHYRSVHQWEFVFLGANQDAFAEASALGIEWSIDLDTVSITDSFVTLTVATTSYFTDGNTVFSFGDDPNGLAELDD